MAGVVFIEELPGVVLDASGARLSYSSGGEEYLRRYPMALWRAFLERETRRLNEWTDEQRTHAVVPFRKRRKGAPPQHN